MKSFAILNCIFVGIAATLLSGCGGAGTDGVVSTRGEGNVPIGKLSMKPDTFVLVSATAKTTSTTYSGSVANDGTVYMEALPYDSYTFNFTPSDSNYVSESFSINVKSQQRYLFDVSLPKKDPTIIVNSISIEIPNSKELQVGKTYPIKVTVDGENVTNLKASVWVDSGSGCINTGNRFLAMVPGDSVISAELLGVRTSIPITVH